jgi:hypothetical protein
VIIFSFGIVKRCCLCNRMATAAFEWEGLLTTRWFLTGVCGDSFDIKRAHGFSR